MGHCNLLNMEKEEREGRKEGKGSFRVLIWPTGCVMILFPGPGKTGRGAGFGGTLQST